MELFERFPKKYETNITSGLSQSDAAERLV